MDFGDDCALVVIDVQNDFCPGGALEVPDGDAVVEKINRLADKFHVKVFTQDWHPADHTSFAANHAGKQPFDTVDLSYGTQVLWPPHCVQGTQGAEFHAGLKTSEADVIVRKGFRAGIDSYSAFFENDRETPTGLDGYVRSRGVEKIFCAGLATDFCVRYSAVDAARLGFKVVLIEDACRAIDLDGSLGAAMKEMRELGVAIEQTSSL